MASIGNIELILVLLFASMGGISFLGYKKRSKKPFKLIAILLGGIACILLLAGLFTPPDLISNLLISIPMTLLFSVLALRKRNQKN